MAGTECMTTFWTLFLHHLIGFIKNKIYHKMHCEKLYNLQSKAYFNCIFLFQKKQKYVINVHRCKKTHFFYMNKGFFVISYSYQLICICKNLWCAFMSTNTTKHGASGMYVEKKLLKIVTTAFKNFF